MASTSTFASLSVPAPEDSMEVSSPANHHLDDDIDIDFGDSYDAIQFVDDEAMIEDEHTRPGTATDDLMQDDDQTVTAPLDEAIMQDGPIIDVGVQQDEDDELIDYDDEEYMDNQPVVVDETFQTVDAYVQSSTTEQAGVDITNNDYSSIQPSEATATEGQSEALSENVVSHEQQITPPIESSVPVQKNDQAPLSAVQEDVVSHENEPEPGPAEQRGESTDTGEAKEPLVEGTLGICNADEAGTKQASPKPLDTSATSKDDGPSTPTDTGLHPMTLQWRGKNMPLFKSRVHAEGLLKDDNLVSVSLADFLSSCKERLSASLDVHFGPEEELVLRFQVLGLTLVEDSPSSFRTSLNDVVELYLQLHRNDSAQEIPPLALRLSLQPRFSETVAFLKENADEGSGMSIIDALWVDPDEDDNYYPDGAGAEQDGVKGDREHVETGEHASLEHADGYDGEEYYDHANEDEYNDDAEENNDQTAGTEDQTEAYGDTDADGSHPAADSGHDIVGPTDVQVEQQSTEPSGDATDSLQSGVAQADPVLDSKDVRIDTANDLAGEYLQDDYIDFSDDDDNDLTESSAELRTASHQDDPLVLATVNRTDMYDKTVDQVTAKETSGEAAAPVAPDAPKEAQDDLFTSDGLFNDDLIDYAEEDLEGEEAQDAEPIDPTSGQKGAAQGTTNSADSTNGEAHDVQYAGNEDDEQFHTAYDLLDDDDFNDATHASESKDVNPIPDHVYHVEDVINFDSDDDDNVPAPAAPRAAIAAVPAQARQTSIGAKRSISALEPDNADVTAKPDTKKTRAG